jgi:predicted enzyme related to lactoylglutathione lyase
MEIAYINLFVSDIDRAIDFYEKKLVAEHKRLVALDVRFTMEPASQPWGGFMALVADPDGNVCYLDEVAVMHPEAVTSD